MQQENHHCEVTDQPLHEAHVYAPSPLVSTWGLPPLLNWAGAGHGAQDIVALRSSHMQPMEGALQNFRTKKNSCHRKMPTSALQMKRREVQGGPETYLRYHSVHWRADRRSSSLPIFPVQRCRGQASIFIVSGCVFQGERDWSF